MLNIKLLFYCFLSCSPLLSTELQAQSAPKALARKESKLISFYRWDNSKENEVSPEQWKSKLWALKKTDKATLDKLKKFTFSIDKLTQLPKERQELVKKALSDAEVYTLHQKKMPKGVLPTDCVVLPGFLFDRIVAVVEK